MSSELVIGGFTLARTGLIPGGAEPTLEQWEHVGQAIAHMEGAIHWWIGDWLNYGERAYGEKYTEGMEKTGFDYSTLSHDKWVAGEIEICRRRQNLSWSHHAEVAALVSEEQDGYPRGVVFLWRREHTLSRFIREGT